MESESKIILIWNVQPNGYSSVSIKLNPKQSSGMGVSLCGSKTETDPPRWGCLVSLVSLSKEPYTHDIAQSIHAAVVSGICEVTLMVVFFLEQAGSFTNIAPCSLPSCMAYLALL